MTNHTFWETKDSNGDHWWKGRFRRVGASIGELGSRAMIAAPLLRGIHVPGFLRSKIKIRSVGTLVFLLALVGFCQAEPLHLSLPEAYGSNDWHPAQLSVNDLAFNTPGIVEGELSVSELTTLAEKGSSLAQRTLGIWYATGSLWYAGGERVTRDPDQSAKWFKLAAERNDAVAENGLGIACLYGLGVAKDPVAALNWFRKSAEAGYAAAQVNLGCCLLSGVGAPVNRDEAVKWLQTASDRGQFRARKDLSEMYLQGEGGPKNYFLAYHWFHKAIELAPPQDRTAMIGADWIVKIGAFAVVTILCVILFFVIKLLRKI